MIIFAPLSNFHHFSALATVPKSVLIKQSLLVYIIIAIVAGVYFKYIYLPQNIQAIHTTITTFVTDESLEIKFTPSEVETMIASIKQYAILLPALPIISMWFSRIIEASLVSLIIRFFHSRKQVDQTSLSAFNILLVSATYAEIITIAATLLYGNYPSYLFTIVFLAIAYIGFKQTSAPSTNS